MEAASFAWPGATSVLRRALLLAVLGKERIGDVGIGKVRYALVLVRIHGEGVCWLRCDFRRARPFVRRLLGLGIVVVGMAGGSGVFGPARRQRPQLVRRWLVSGLEHALEVG